MIITDEDVINFYGKYMINHKYYLHYIYNRYY